MIKQFCLKQFRLAKYSFLFIYKISVWPIDRTLSGATTPGQNWPGSDGNKGVQHISQSSGITEALPSDCLVSYPGHSWGWGSALADKAPVREIWSAYSYEIQIIWKQIYLTPDRYTTSGSEWIWLVGWVLWHINLCRLFNAKFIFIQINSAI